MTVEINVCSAEA